ncbi:hypothetical protein [Streptomyces sp. ST2-7A]|uniref:MinD/ParA family ATP-binding protein n=1 Tax=Streptomyces sp. ST2-7A TaxID=2907214 RepID=UPI001F38E6F8|nr:hypothetical protein [Streptomyces sp. ST2-7A]MCE7080598.1 hypothetical protein [Streptomyces sp. ST2-7A]
MALIALAADKGAPGVTTAAVALAALWPRRVLLAETDPAGGDLVYRASRADGGPLDPGTGLLSLAATARRGIAAEQLWDHSQRVAGGLDVIVGLGTSEQAAGLTGQWGTLGRAFADLAGSPHPEAAADVIADCGRLGADSPTAALVQHATLLLVVTGAAPEHLARARDRVIALGNKLHGGRTGPAHTGLPRLGVVLVADPQRGHRLAGEVNEMLSGAGAPARVVGLVADDPAGAEQLAGRRRGRLDRSLLIRSARKVVADLHRVFHAELTPAGGPGGRPPVPHPGGPTAGAPAAMPPGTGTPPPGPNPVFPPGPAAPAGGYGYPPAAGPTGPRPVEPGAGR